MKRLLIAAIAAALVAGAIGLASMQPVSAQQGGPSVCLSLPPGDHTFTAPSQDREGEVSFTVTVGEGGLVTGFTEPGGQSIPPAALLEIFTGEDAYPLPEGVSFVECEAGDDSMMEDAAPPVCVNLPEGSHSGSVNAGGQAYEIVINVGSGHEVVSVEVLGQTYSAAEALALLEGFGATLPRGVEIVPCPDTAEDSMMEDTEDEAGAVYPATGTGGLAGAADLTGLWAGLGTLAALAIAIAAVTHRRRAHARIRA